VNKFVLGVGIASILGVLALTVVVWIAVVGAANEEPTDLQASEPVPVPPTPAPVIQEKKRDPQVSSRQKDREAEAARRERFKEGMEKSRQKQEAREQEAVDNAASQNRVSRGETVTLPSGLAVTAHSYSPSVQSDNEFLQPEAGKKFVAIDVEGCAGSGLGDGEGSLNPFDFSLQMPDNTRIGPTMPVVDPALHHADLLPGECVRGLVSFQVPKGQRPSYVRFDQIWPEEVARWSLD
jgi:hypothetical protein